MLTGNGVKFFEGKQVTVGIISAAEESVPAQVTETTPLYFMSADNYGILVLVGAKDANDKNGQPLYLPWTAIAGITVWNFQGSKSKVA